MQAAPTRSHTVRDISPGARLRPAEHPHGSLGRRRHCTEGPDGRACFKCRLAHSQDELRRRQEKAAGYSRWMDAGPVKAHLTELLKYGTITDVARQADLKFDTIYYVSQLTVRVVSVNGNGEARLLQRRVHRNTAAGIMSVTVDQLSRFPRNREPVRPIQRLVEGMAAQGWSLEWQSREAGLYLTRCHYITQQSPDRSINTTTAAAIRDLAAKVGDSQGPSTKARAHARRMKWLPLAWGTDEEIAEYRRTTHKACVNPWAEQAS